MDYRTRARGNGETQWFLESFGERGFTVGQIKFVIRELVDLPAGAPLDDIRAATLGLTSTEVSAELRQRFTPMDTMTHGLVRDAARVQIRAALHSLGESVSEIVASLERAGIMGIPSSACACPIAQWLFVALDPWTVTVAGDHIDVDGVAIETPDVIKRFIMQVDSDAHRQLVAGHLPASR